VMIIFEGFLVIPSVVSLPDDELRLILL